MRTYLWTLLLVIAPAVIACAAEDPRSVVGYGSPGQIALTLNDDEQPTQIGKQEIVVLEIARPTRLPEDALGVTGRVLLNTESDSTPIYIGQFTFAGFDEEEIQEFAFNLTTNTDLSKQTRSAIANKKAHLSVELLDNSVSKENADIQFVVQSALLEWH